MSFLYTLIQLIFFIVQVCKLLNIKKYNANLVLEDIISVDFSEASQTHFLLYYVANQLVLAYYKYCSEYNLLTLIWDFVNIDRFVVFIFENED